MRNPKWHRDEIILALDLYSRLEPGKINSSNPDIEELSLLLNRLPIHDVRPDEAKFRNPNGVSLKLSNFLAIDPSYHGVGMQSFSQLDEKVFKEFEIVPRFNQLNQSAKELLSDFKEVEDNFKEITKGIYQKHADGSLTKSDILEFTFDALEALKESQQGKCFYAFWTFILDPELQNRWESLTRELYKTLEEKSIPVNDPFLKGMKKHLHGSGQKVYKANDKMAEKLSRIIRESESSKSETTKSIIQEIKKQLVEISKTKKKKKPDISFELETEIEINILFERKLTLEQKVEISYTDKPLVANEDITSSNHLNKLFSQSNIDKELLRQRIKNILKEKSQTTLLDVVENYGGLEKGLPELFGYIGIAKEFKHSINLDKTQNVVFDVENKKQIKIPEIILTK